MSLLKEIKGKLLEIFPATGLAIVSRKNKLGMVLWSQRLGLHSNVNQIQKRGDTLQQMSRLLLIILLGATHLTACANQSAPVPPKPIDTPSDTVDMLNTARLIIKFSDTLSISAVSTKLEQISEQTGIKLVYVREMSGDAHVIIAQNIASDDQLARLLNDINKRNDVQYVETDVLMQHQKSNPLHLKQKGTIR